MGCYWKSDTADITVAGEEVINDISTKALELELEDRKELQRTDPEEFKKQERNRDGLATVTIELDDYNLINKDDVDPDFFADEDLIEFLETHRSYAVFYKGAVGTSDADSVCTYLMDLPKYKLKEFMCDTLGLNHFATTDDIINELKMRLN